MHIRRVHDSMHDTLVAATEHEVAPGAAGSGGVAREGKRSREINGHTPTSHETACKQARAVSAAGHLNKQRLAVIT